FDRSGGDLRRWLALIFAIGLAGWAQYARTARALAQSELGKDYARAAQLTGLSGPAILRRHIFPNVAAPLIAIAAMDFALAIVAEATLSILGVGMPPDSPSLGAMIRTGYDFLFSGQWWMFAFPGIALAALALAAHILG